MVVNDPVRPQIANVEEDVILSVSPTAVTMIRTLLEQRQIPNHALRVFVSGGGCSGLQYGMAFEAAPRDFDAVVDVDGVQLVVDPSSLLYLKGATIDYVDSLMGGGFRIENPNAVSSCGCGSSFRTKDDGSAAEAGSSASAGGCSSCSH
ncbi:MAG: iron-sulfur cluster insertion protein ErpA [bacterium]|nr:iron-sulfur cluster insertion protein ErpA [bacterium]